MTGSATRRSPERVFTIPPGAPFLATLAEALLDGRLVDGFSRADGPLGLAAATIYVPTRRSARALAATLAARLDAPSALLPRIVPLGALDETETLFAESGLDDPFAPELPPAIGDIARRMLLTRLILAWGQAVRHAIVSVEAAGTRRLFSDEALLVATTPSDAWHLSGELAQLIDELAIEDVAWSRVEPLGTASFDRYWRITLDFLDIAIQAYPAILAELGLVDPAARQIKLIEGEVARLAAGRHAGPVVVAGSTGSNAATGRLIAAVARLPRGAVVLPGLDQELDERSWSLVGAGRDGEDPAGGHPQVALRALLGAIGIERRAVLPLGLVPAPLQARGRLVSEALRPAATTEAWRALALDTEAALARVTLIEAADEREEALAIAVALREALEGAGTAALVTPDRELGQRVREELARWDLDVESSSGEPLGQTPAGAIARLVLDCALSDLAPVEVLSLLHHPDLRLGRPRAEVVRLARRLELAVLRGVLPQRALHDPAALMARAKAARSGRDASASLRGLGDTDFAELAAFLDAVLSALGPLRALEGSAPLPDWLAAHEAALAALCRDEHGDFAPGGPGSAALGDLFAELDESADAAIRLDRAGYAALFDRLAAETPVRGPSRSHPALKILGLLEARLLSVDRVVLGGLDETIWPPQARTDPFLNRPMRAALGLPPPERRIARTAHDFTMAFGTGEVIVTRSAKRGGAPTVPSRFLQRLAAVGGAAWHASRARGRRYLDFARALDRPDAVAPVRRPAPKPRLELRPASLSVTRIEVLRRDPYAIFAERILELRPAERIGAVAGLREIGTGFHDLIARHQRGTPALVPAAELEAALLARARETFAEPLAHATVRTFLWPRVERWIRAFLAWDADRRAGAARLLVEESGRWRFSLPDGSTFTLTAQADRIEVSPTGEVTIFDFKTGRAPTIKEVKAGFAPQLTLEAAMVAAGGFPTLGSTGRVAGASYVKFGTGDAVTSVPLVWKDGPTFDDVVARHRDELVALLAAFRDPGTGYLARPFPQFASRFGDYDHLARVKEWSATGGLDPDGEG